MQGDKGTSKSVAHIRHLGIFESVLQIAGEPVGFPLEVARYEVEADAHESFEWRQDHLEEQERNDRRRMRSDLV